MNFRALCLSFVGMCGVFAPLSWADGVATAARDSKAQSLPQVRSATNPIAPAVNLVANASSTNWELYKNLTIPPGGHIALDSKLDFTSRGKVSFTARCTSASWGGLSMSSLDFQALWTVPGAELFGVVEHMAGSKFSYIDSGGGLFQVYGSKFRMVIFNSDKTSDATLDQVLIYTSGTPAMF